jgi:hypothetical protein
VARTHPKKNFRGYRQALYRVKRPLQQPRNCVRAAVKLRVCSIKIGLLKDI